MNKRQRELTNTLAELAAPVIAARKPAEKAPKLSVRMASADTAELLIYGRIGGGGWFDEGGITDMNVIDALRDAGPVANVHVRINSGGGDVFEGVAIHTALRRYPGTVTTYIDGLAASAASFIAMAGDRVVIARGAMMMIHDGMTSTYGGPRSHERSTELLHKISDVIADLYAARAGEDAAHWRHLMSQNDEDGTWFTADEAVACGLADEMSDADEDAPVTADVALRQWANEFQCVPPRLQAVLDSAPAPADEQERAQGSDEHEPAQRVDHSAPEPVHNADQLSADELADMIIASVLQQWTTERQPAGTERN